MKKIIWVFLFIGFIITATTTATQAQQPGAPDSSFSVDGRVTTAVGSAADYGRAVAIQADGKIVVAGYAIGVSNYHFALIRYNTNGTLDNTFGTSGVASCSFPGDNRANSVAIQPDGKIVAAGFCGGSNNDFAITRFKTNGTLDSIFGTNGMVITNLAFSDDEAQSVIIDNNGKIVVSGNCNNFVNMDVALVRYNSNGSIDSTFNGDGIVVIPIGNSNDYGQAVTVQPDGKYVVTGYGSGDLVVLRYDTSGIPDPSFGAGQGYVTTSIGTLAWAYSVAIINSNKILVGGKINIGGFYDFVTACYDSTGNLDTTFGTGGIVITDIAGDDDEGYSMALQYNGKIIMAGYSSDGTSSRFALIRYHSTGVIDSTFGSNGIVTTDFGPLADRAYGVCLQPDGKIITAGYSNNGTDMDFAAARYWGDICTTVSFSQTIAISSPDSFIVGNNIYTTTGTYIDTLVTSEGCDSVVTTHLTVYTAIIEFAEELIQLTITPNPFRDELSIKGTIENAEINVFDMMGKEIVRQETKDKETKIKTDALLPGVYIFNYNDGNKNVTSKLIKL